MAELVPVQHHVRRPSQRRGNLRSAPRQEQRDQSETCWGAGFAQAPPRPLSPDFDAAAVSIGNVEVIMTSESGRERPASGEDARNTEQAAKHAKVAAVRTSDAAVQTQRAAQQTAAAAHVAKTSAERTTELAADRTVLAFERTYASWVRTGLVALASGIGARRLLEGAVPHWTAIGTGIILLLFSAFCFVAGVWRHLFRVEAPEPAARKLPTLVLMVVNGALALVALAALFGIMLGGT
jgi:putative membrane protein